MQKLERHGWRRPGSEMSQLKRLLTSHIQNLHTAQLIADTIDTCATDHLQIRTQQCAQLGCDRCTGTWALSLWKICAGVLFSIIHADRFSTIPNTAQTYITQPANTTMTHRLRSKTITVRHWRSEISKTHRRLQTQHGKPMKIHKL